MPKGKLQGSRLQLLMKYIQWNGEDMLEFATWLQKHLNYLPDDYPRWGDNNASTREVVENFYLVKNELIPNRAEIRLLEMAKLAIRAVYLYEQDQH